MRNGPSTELTFLIAILAVAFLLRVACAIGVQVHLDRGSQEVCLIAGDADGYWRLAGSLARGEDYSLYDPPRKVMRMPGFPALLAIPRLLLFDNLLAARIWLAIIGTAACGFTYLLGKELMGGTAGLWGAGLTAISPVLTIFSVLILSETAFAATLTASLVLLAKLVHRLNAPILPGERRLAVFAGLSIALATMMRPTWLLVAPITVIGLLRRNDYSRRLRAGLLILLGAYGVLSLWGLRNLAVTGHFTLTTFWVGPSLYDGLNPHATGDSDMRFFDEENLLTRMSEYDMDREYRRRAWQFAAEHPGRTFELMLIKAWRYWSPWPNAGQFQSKAIRIVVTVSFLLLLIPAVWGTCLIRRSWTMLAFCRCGRSPDQATPPDRRSPLSSWTVLAFCWGPILYFTAVHLWFVGSIRYRLPAEYPLTVLSGVGCASWMSMITNAAPAARNKEQA